MTSTRPAASTQKQCRGPAAGRSATTQAAPDPGARLYAKQSDESAGSAPAGRAGRRPPDRDVTDRGPARRTHTIMNSTRTYVRA